MATTYTLGYNSQIYYSANGVSYTLLAQTEDLNSVANEIGKVKITNNSSPSNSQEYAPGMQDPQETEVTWIYTATQQALLWAIQQAGTVYTFKEQFPDGSGWKWTGWISKIQNETKTENEAIKGKLSLVPNTAVNYMAAVS